MKRFIKEKKLKSKLKYLKINHYIAKKRNNVSIQVSKFTNSTLPKTGTFTGNNYTYRSSSKPKYFNINSFNYKVYKIIPSVDISNLSEEGIENYDYELNNFFEKIATFTESRIYKFDKSVPICKKKMTDNEILNHHIQTQNKQISKYSNMQVPHYYVIIEEKIDEDLTGMITSINNYSNCFRLETLVQEDEILFEDVVNCNVKSAKKVKFDGINFQVDNVYYRFIEVSNFVKEDQYSLFLTGLLNEKGLDWMWKINPIVSKDVLSVKVDNSISEIEDGISEETKSSKRKKAIKELTALDGFVEALDDTKIKVCTTRLVIKIIGTSKEQLNSIEKELIEEYKGHFVMHEIIYQLPMHYWMLTNLTKYPLSTYTEPQKYLTTSMLALSGLFNFKDYIDEKGLFLGGRANGRLQLDFNRVFSTDNDVERLSGNIMVSGKKGSGKSTFIKDLILCQLSEGNSVFVIDVQSDFCNITEAVGGYNLDITENIKFNPLQITSWGFSKDITSIITNHVEFLVSFMLLCSKIDSMESVLDLNTLLTRFYTQLNPEQEWSNNQYPTFSDLYDYAKENSEIFDYSETSLKIIMLFIDGSYANYFNSHSTEIVTESALTNYNLSSLGDEMREIMQFVILYQFKKEIIKNKKYNNKHLTNHRVFLIIDEAHKVFEQASAMVKAEIVSITREVRKFQANLVYATQSFLDGSKVHGLLDQVLYRVVMKHEVKIIKNGLLAEELGVENRQIQHLSKCKRGIGIVTIEDHVFDFKHVPSTILMDKYFDGGRDTE